MNRTTTTAPAPTVSREVQLAKFEIFGLFDEMDHSITFPTPPEGNPTPSLVILHGPNGVGKTTMLRMIDGMMRLDFNSFRRVPFRLGKLHLTTGESIEVEPKREHETLRSLMVRYLDFEVELDPRTPGALRREEQGAVEEFRQRFFQDTDLVNLELIETTRILGTLDSMDDDDPELYMDYPDAAARHYYLYRRARTSNPKARASQAMTNLAPRVERFVREAQINYRRFFMTTEPDLFPKILLRLTDTKPRPVRAEDLLGRLRIIREQDEQARKLGLEPEQWDYEQLARFLEERKDSGDIAHALTVLSAYVETLESGAAERELVATRLRTFERLVSEFFIDKRIEIRPRTGFAIITNRGEELSEAQLSSGEYHLLYLMVSALVTQRRGTVIAIDEPEMSMHVKWQRRLISALTECASNAEPQFIFATHSPDIAAEYPDDMVMLRTLD